jgi:hypothetical protein
MAAGQIFGDDFLLALKTLVNVHHSIYPLIPPQGIYFESLVEQAFKRVRKPFATVEATTPNQPTHDLIVEHSRISLKTETGAGTKLDLIHITKLCTTEKEPWAPDILVQRATAHLTRYDVILMLRAIWNVPDLIHYQLLEIPVDLLKLLATAMPIPVGSRKGRRSLGADVYREGTKQFHVHFDGSDGKCQIRNLPVKNCNMLVEWDLRISI